jgi:hypothetical protein
MSWKKGASMTKTASGIAAKWEADSLENDHKRWRNNQKNCLAGYGSTGKLGSHEGFGS